MSGVPKAIEGLWEIRSNPHFFGRLTTGAGPTLSIKRALTVFTELAKAFLRVRICPYLSPEFLDTKPRHCQISSVQYKKEHRVKYHMEISAIDRSRWHIKWLEGEPICLLP